MAAPPKNQLITEQELIQLPPSARMAFAARCVLRVLPLIGSKGDFDFWSGNLLEYIKTIEKAIHVVFNSVFNDSISNSILIEASSNVTNAAAGNTPEPISEVIRSISAAVLARIDVNYAADAVNLSITAYSYDNAPPSIINVIKADFEQLFFYKDSKGFNASQIRSFIEQSLWPNGKPKGWEEVEKNFRIALEKIGYIELWNRYSTNGVDYLNLPLETPLETIISSSEENTEKDKDNDKDQEKTEKPIFLSSSYFPIHTHDIEAVFNVDIHATIMAGILENFNDEKGQFVGIFGQWGRGKTYFWEKIKTHLEKTDKKLYHPVTFQAWRYQDTPASWAYLYEVMVTDYLNKPKTIFDFRWIIYWYKIIKLSVRRGHWKKPFFALLIAIILQIISLFEFQFLQFGWLLILFPIGKSYFKKEYSTKAIDIFEKLTKKVSFEGILGTQAEIQKELIVLLKTWFSNPKKKKLLLFVDDIDRCDETRIVQIVDALRVMLEDEALVTRMVVIAAVDERILMRAIRNKYFDLVQRSEYGTKEDRDKQLEALTREYMDKLFITGIKLPRLSSNDLLQYLNKLSNKMSADGGEEPESVKPVEQAVERTDISAETDIQESKDEVNKETETQSSVKTRDENVDIKTIKHDLKPAHLSHDEKAVISEIVNRIHESVTPRQIRIFLYRYMMALRLFSMTTQYNRFNQEENKVLADLILEYGIEESIHQLIRKKEELLSKDDKDITIETRNISLTRPKEFFQQLFEVLEMVIAY